jgi:hypothetical protein
LHNLRKRLRDLAYKAKVRDHTPPSFTPEDIGVIFDSAPCCELCGTRFENNNQKRIDHCHSTGSFRGVLCDPCNTCLGHLEKALPRIEWLLDYIAANGALHDSST